MGIRIRVSVNVTARVGKNRQRQNITELMSGQKENGNKKQTLDVRKPKTQTVCRRLLSWLG